MNPFLQCLAAAEKDRQTHYERAAAQTREHFARHPECRRIIISQDADGFASRGRGEINIEARCQPGWFDRKMWKSNYYQADRPVEVEVEGVQEKIWVELQKGRAVDVHEFMRDYLKTLLRAPMIVQSIQDLRRNREQAVNALAPVIQ